MKVFLKKHLLPFLEEVRRELGPEKYTEENLGKIESYSVISGGGLFSSTKTEVVLKNRKYLLNGVLNGKQSEEDVILRHWPKTHPNEKYLIIDGNKYSISN